MKLWGDVMRKSEITRKTKETDIMLSWVLDGSGKSEIKTGCGFLDHMLTLFAKHGRFDLDISCRGDVEVDYHHSAEDIGICLGNAFLEALSDMKGIERYADIILPMDEALILCACDISGRSHLSFNVQFDTEKIGDFDTELIQEFFEGFVRSSKITLHIKKLDGVNSHHVAEGIFKAFARTISKACKINDEFKNEIPSTKGMLI